MKKFGGAASISDFAQARGIARAEKQGIEATGQADTAVAINAGHIVRRMRRSQIDRGGLGACHIGGFRLRVA